MSHDLEYLMGDGVSQKIAVPKSFNVDVGRIGIEVRFVIGNADPIMMTWREAMRLGDSFFVEGSRAIKAKRPAELRLGHNVMQTSGRTLATIGQWLMAKAGEAKFLDGFGGKPFEAL